MANPLLFLVAEEIPRQAMSSHRVLIVDDDDAIRLLIERVLRRASYEVDCARDGFEAIEKLSQNCYGAILLDLTMPRMDGHGVLRFLEEKRAVAVPRVIVMSASLAAHTDGMNTATYALLPKPFDIDQLVDNVRACVPLTA